MSSMLEVSHLTKRYGQQTALDSVSFSVARGEVFALLGPNGAGKTTTLEIIEGIREPDGGAVQVAGIDALRHRDKALSHLGVQLQTQGLPAGMTAQEALYFFSHYQGCRPDFALLDRFGLAEKRHVAFRDLSMGLQRRLMLALALAHDPEIIILDEPTAALDVESRHILHALIREEKAKGKTILLASHDMAEVEQLADRALVLVRGQAVALGSPRQLTSQGNHRTRLSLQTRDGSLIAGGAVIDSLRSSAAWQAIGDSSQVDDEGYLKLRLDKPAPVLAALLAAVEAAHDEIVDLRLERPSLEERFLELAAHSTPGAQK